MTRDWQLGAVLRYQSGLPLGEPTSLNLLTNQLARGPTAFRQQRPELLESHRSAAVPEGPELQVLQPADRPGAKPGGLDRCPPRHLDHQRAILQQLSLAAAAGRIHELRSQLPDRHEGYNLQVGMEFQNVFNRTFLSPPSVANPNLATPTTSYAEAIINNRPPLPASELSLLSTEEALWAPNLAAVRP